MINSLKERVSKQFSFQSLFVPLAAFILINLLASMVGFFTISVWIENSTATNEANLSATYLRTLYSHLSETESSQRGYIITSDKDYLSTYRKNVADSQAALDTVKKDKRLASFENTSSIVTLSERKLDEMERTLQIRRNDGIEAATLEVNRHLGRNIMTEDRELTAQVLGEIDKEISTRLARINNLSGIALVAIPFNLIASFGLAYSAYRLLQRQRKDALELEQLNTELNRSNGELQDFASIASHDLQEPLRKIQAFGDRLATRTEQFDEDGKLYLDRMLDASRRMRVLIEDLLDFSRVTTKAQPFKRTSLRRIVDGVLSDLEIRISDLDATVSVTPLPTVWADEPQMRQLFQNLISNALKFHKPETPPVVTISYRSIEDVAVPYAEITVTDNGIGFDEKYLDRIFTIFQRLNSREEYDGTGIGLAVVKKIIDRHSGTITAKSQMGEGSTFIITLPLAGHDTMNVENTEEAPENDQ